MRSSSNAGLARAALSVPAPQAANSSSCKAFSICSCQARQRAAHGAAAVRPVAMGSPQLMKNCRSRLSYGPAPRADRASGRFLRLRLRPVISRSRTLRRVDRVGVCTDGDAIPPGCERCSFQELNWRRGGPSTQLAGIYPSRRSDDARFHGSGGGPSIALS